MDEFVNGWMAAREYYGIVDDDTAHGAECDKTENVGYRCTCNPDAQRASAQSGSKKRN